MANITLDDLSPRQIANLKRIADGQNADTDIWSQLFDMELVDAAYDDEKIMRDSLTEVGRKLLEQVKPTLKWCELPVNHQRLMEEILRDGGTVEIGILHSILATNGWLQAKQGELGYVATDAAIEAYVTFDEVAK